MPSDLLASKLVQVPTQDYIVSAISREQIDFSARRILDVPIICADIRVFNVDRTIRLDLNFVTKTSWIRHWGMIRNCLPFVGSGGSRINEVYFYVIDIEPVFFESPIHQGQVI